MTVLRMAACVLLLVSTQAMAVGDDYRFQVFLDGKEIGTHSFEFEPLGEGASHYRVISQASYQVKVLFVTAYTYEHRSVENWRDGCVLEMRSATDDNGDDFRVVGERSGDLLQVAVNDRRQLATGDCVRTFAYWQPSLLDAGELLNSQTGKLEEVALQDLGITPLPWDEGTTARTLELTSPQGPIRLWYDEDDRRWLGLRSPLANGRVLEYRPAPAAEVAVEGLEPIHQPREWSL